MKEGLLLHVGCGGDPIPEWAVGRYKEVRLDISPNNQPDILASMADMGDIGTYDAIHCSHALEHLVPHEGDAALREFVRVLNLKGLPLFLFLILKMSGLLKNHFTSHRVGQ